MRHVVRKHSSNGVQRIGGAALLHLGPYLAGRKLRTPMPLSDGLNSLENLFTASVT